MDEPSVLDYLKARLTPWRGPAPEIPPRSIDVPATSEELPERASAVATDMVETTQAPSSPGAIAVGEQTEARASISEFWVARWPWRIMLAFFLAVIGQRSLGPPDRGGSSGAILFLAAGAVLVWSFRRGEWRLPPWPKSQAKSVIQTVRITGLYVGLPLAALAYLSFGGNLITGLNLVIWLIAVGAFIWAFWSPTALVNWRAKIRLFLVRPYWQPKITFNTVILLATIALIVFFRIYRLADVPPEMTSDHAEKLLDVGDVLRGETHIFFPRNAGREALQMYLNAAIAMLLKTGLSFQTLKIGTVIPGLLTLPFIYLLGKEVGTRRAAFIASLFAGIGYWPNVISRVGLRFPFYPLFTAITLYFLLRGIRTSSRNQFVLAGVSLGLSLYGYTAAQILPIVVLAAFGLYLVHSQSSGQRRQAIGWLAIVVILSLIVSVPMIRYFVEQPTMFSYRSLTRLSGYERPLPGPAWQLFFGNLWNALAMFSRSAGGVWLASIPGYPALDVVSGALAHLGAMLVLIRYVQKRHWLDSFLLITIPLLMMPSILSLAFPEENPNLYRTGGALVPVFLLVGIASDALLTGLKSGLGNRRGVIAAWGLGILLLVFSSVQNYDWVFNKFRQQYQLSAWNTSELGQVIRSFDQSIGTIDNVWVVAYPHWVDTRLVGFAAGYPGRDFALWPEQLVETTRESGPKLFLVKPEDEEALRILKDLYPQGNLQTHQSKVEHKDFLVYVVPPENLGQ